MTKELKYSFRTTQDAVDKIRELAKEDCRSVSMEIEWLIREEYKRREGQ